MVQKLVTFLVALGAIWAVPLCAVSVQIFVEQPAPPNCSSAVKSALNRKLQFLTTRISQPKIYIKPIERMIFLRGSGGAILSPSDFLSRMASTLPEDEVLAAARQVLSTANARPNFISCVLGKNCAFIKPPNSEETDAKFTAHHATLGGSLELEAFTPDSEPTTEALSSLVWKNPEYVAIVVDPPQHEFHHLLVDWYADWVHEASHVVVLDRVGEWLEALQRLSSHGAEIRDGALKYLRLKKDRQVLEAAYYYLLTEGIAHQTDNLIHTSHQASPDYVPDIVEVQQHILAEMETLRPGSGRELQITSPQAVFPRARALFDSMQQTIQQAAALPH
ncbi:MAG: hypothetical protein R3B54_01955 [Bdellovibrionota bacterium]